MAVSEGDHFRVGDPGVHLLGQRDWSLRRIQRQPAQPAQPAQTAARCSTTTAGVAISRRVSLRCPICLPSFLPLFWRRLLVVRARPSLEGGLPLLWYGCPWPAAPPVPARAPPAPRSVRAGARSRLRVERYELLASCVHATPALQVLQVYLNCYDSGSERLHARCSIAASRIYILCRQS